MSGTADASSRVPSNPPTEGLHGEALHRRYAATKALHARRVFNRLEFQKWYPKQLEFFYLGAEKRERYLTAGNQYGKTEAGAGEFTYHLTGRYPEGWKGRRFEHPIVSWCCGESGVAVRDNQQWKLCGQPGVEAAFGTGMIPKEDFYDKPSLSRGVTDAYDTVIVKHYTNGVHDGYSTCIFKSYEMGRTKFQGKALHVIWLDEEPPMDIYSECIARTVATGGLLFLTYTPVAGLSEVTKRFTQEVSNDRGMVRMGIEDALHIPPERRQAIIDAIPEHERDARVHGIPGSGEGRIFTTPEATIREPQLEAVPDYWFKLWGIDFGIYHPFAAVLIAWDKDADVIHVVHSVWMQTTSHQVMLPVHHVAAMKPIGEQVRVAWPKDGHQKDKGSGTPLRAQYSTLGLKMLPDHATWPDGGDSTWAGVIEMQQRFETGRLRIAAHLSRFFEEYRMYHLEKGEIVKKDDDTLSALRIAIMMKRYAKPGPLGFGPSPGLNARRRAELARAREMSQEDLDKEYWGW